MMSVENEQELPSAYDYVIKGKAVPENVYRATIARIAKLGTPHEQYLACRKEGIKFDWPEDFYPAGEVSRGMEGGVPTKKEP